MFHKTKSVKSLKSLTHSTWFLTCRRRSNAPVRVTLYSKVNSLEPSKEMTLLLEMTLTKKGAKFKLHKVIVRKTLNLQKI